MAASPWTVPTANRFIFYNGGFILDGDTFKMALFLSTSNIGLGSTTYAALTNEHANANGYTTGGKLVTLTLASGLPTVPIDILTDPVWTAAGGPITARWAVLYEVGGLIVCYALLDTTAGGTDVGTPDGQTFTVQANAGGVLIASFVP